MVALQREVADPAPHPSTDAIPATLRRGGGSPRQVLVISLIGTTVLALFASRDLTSWAERLSGGTLAEEVQNIAAGWDQAVAALGFVRLHDTLRSATGHLLNCQWDNCPIHPL
jgi:hypothetical protein